MLKYKAVRTKGKIPLSRYFQKFKEGDYVAVAKEHSVIFGYSNRLQGRTGIVIGKRGEAYEVKIKDLNKPKTYMIKPIHLKKVELVK